MPLRPRLERLALLLPAIAAAAIYLPALRNDFVWDDRDLLFNQPFLRVPGLWKDALGEAVLMFSNNYFRPAAVATLLADVRAWGLDPAGFHLTNLALHALNTLLVTLLARAALRGRDDSRAGLLVPAVVGLSYALHPALTESVSFVSGRFDLLMTTFVALALYADARLEAKPAPRAIAIGILFLAALLSKESAIVLPPLLYLWRGARATGAGRLRSPAGMHALAALAVALAVYLALRWHALGHLYEHGSTSTIPAGDPLQRVLLVGRTAAEYAAVLLFPFGTLSPLHVGPLPVPRTDAAAWLGLAGLAATLAALAVARRRAPSASALALAGVAALFPALNAVPLELNGGTFAAERYLTLPLVPLALVPCLAWFELAPARPAIARSAAAALAGWLLACGITVATTIPRWRDPLSLWTWAAERAPGSALPHVNLSSHYIDMGDWARTSAEADAALERDPGNATGWNNRGVAFFHEDRFAEALSAWERSAQLEPRDLLVWNNMANALRALGRTQEAERMLIDRVLRVNPGFGPAHYSLGALYLAIDRPDLAVAPLRRAAELSPPDQQGAARDALEQAKEPWRWLRLGELLARGGDAGGADRAWGQAISLGAPAVDVAVSRSAALIGAKDWRAAEELLRAALAESPGDARLHNNLGAVARANGDLASARDHFLRASELAPDWELPRRGLAELSAP